MNKNLVTAIVILLVLSLAGISFIQVSLIRQGITVREAQFDQSVYDALNRTAYHLEQIYTLKKLNSHSLDINTSGSLRKSSILNNLLKHSGLTGISKSGRDSMQAIDDIPGTEIRIHTDSTTGFQSIEFTSTGSSPQDEMAADFLEHSLTQMLGDIDPIESFLSQSALEELLQNELKLAGIKANFQYSLIEPNTYTTVYSNINNLTEEIYKKSYQRPVFSNSFFGNEWLLLLYFPDKKTYILKSLWLLLSASTAFVIIILLCFIASLVIIIRQKKLNDLKTDFINNMTHELKTPVATISLAGEMLKNSRVLNDPEKAKNYAGIILEENNRLSNHIERVLQFAKYDKGQLELKKEFLDLHDIIRNVAETFHIRIQNDNGELSLDLQAGNPNILADKHHMESVFSNLLDNALKYKKNHLKIQVRTRNQPGGILISIEDEGIGMTQETQKKIFEKFYRVSTGNLHDVKGFGLGLSYVKAIIDAHKGNIEVHSELNKGSRFDIYLPYTK